MPSSEKQGPGHTLQVTGSLKSDGRTPHTSILISVVVINKDHRVVFSEKTDNPGLMVIALSVHMMMLFYQIWG